MESMASEIRSCCKLGPGDAAELAAGVAELSKAGLPLPAGLRALAEELPGRRLRSTLCAMAARMERGESIEAILGSVTESLPLHLHGLLVAGLRTGRLPELMEEYAQVEQERRYLRQRLRANFAYLTFLSIAVTVFAFYIQEFFLKEAGFLIDEHSGRLLGIFSITAWKMFGQVAWFSAGLSLFLLLMPLSLSNFRGLARLTPLTDNLPFLGPLLRDLRMASFSRVMALLLDNGTPLHDAIRMAGAAGDRRLARDCRMVAAELERGRPLTESLAENRRFPRNWIPLVQWGLQTQSLPQAFRMAAQLHDGRAANQYVLISTVAAPFVFLMIASIICLAGSIIALPTVANGEKLYRMLVMWRWRGPAPTTFAMPSGFAFSSMFSPLLLGIALLITKRLITLRHDPNNENFVETGLSIAGWVLLAVGLAGNLLWMMGGLLIFWMPALAVVSIFIALKRRRAMQQALLGTMAVSVERFIPLTPTIEAFADDIGGKFGVRARKFASLLQSGVALPVALRQVKRIVPKQLMPVIRVGYESGALAQGLSEAAAAEDTQHLLWGPVAAKMLYIAAIPCLGSAFVFCMLYINAGYQRLFKHDHVPCSPLTRALMDVCDFAAIYWPILVAVAASFVLLFLYCLLRYLGVALFDPPGLDRILRRQHTAAILDSLAIAVENDRPMFGILQTLSGCYPTKSIRTRLNNVLFDLVHGGEWCESLHHRGLIRESDLAILQSAERAGNLPWALRELADSNRRRLAYRLNAVVQLLFPLVVVCFGGMVLLIAIALYLPVISYTMLWL
jgi:general secretion pathway protein F